jgi:hypothetical protein
VATPYRGWWRSLPASFPGVRLVPSRPAVSFGEGGTVVPRKLVPPRVWILMRASCLPFPASCVKSRPDAMAGFSAQSCVTPYEANFQVSKFFPQGGGSRPGKYNP